LTDRHRTSQIKSGSTSNQLHILVLCNHLVHVSYMSLKAQSDPNMSSTSERFYISKRPRPLTIAELCDGADMRENVVYVPQQAIALSQGQSSRCMCCLISSVWLTVTAAMPEGGCQVCRSSSADTPGLPAPTKTSSGYGGLKRNRGSHYKHAKVATWLLSRQGEAHCKHCPLCQLG
jgi:hypothetical protein